MSHFHSLIVLIFGIMFTVLTQQRTYITLTETIRFSQMRFLLTFSCWSKICDKMLCVTCAAVLFVDCLLSSAHHLCEGGLYDSHHQALQANNLLHVKSYCRVASRVWVFWFLRGSFLRLHLVWAAILGQADGRNTGGVLQQVADFSQAVSDEAVKELGSHDGGSRTCMSIKHAPKVEGDSCTILKHESKKS